MARIQAICTYPLKSAAGRAVDACAVDAIGLHGDRRWMLVDESGRFVTGRVLPGLVLLQVQPRASELLLQWHDGSSRTAWPDLRAESLQVQVWKDTVQAAPVQPDVDEWLSGLFGRQLRLVHLVDPLARPLASKGLAGHVSFADGYPLLLTSQRSLQALSEAVGRSLDMRRFRPNLVIDGVEPYQEDRWHRIAIGGIAFRVVSRCSRCIFTTVDPDTAERDPGREPLATLERERRFEEGACFGVNLMPEREWEGRASASGRRDPSVAVGDSLIVLEQSL